MEKENKQGRNFLFLNFDMLPWFAYISQSKRVGIIALKLRANGRNNSHYCWPNNVGSCCVCLHVAKSLAGFKLCATTCNNMQQGMQTDATILGVVGQQSRPFNLHVA